MNEINKINKKLIKEIMFESKKQSDLYIPSGAFFLITKKTLVKNKSFTSNKMNFYKIKNIKESIDIDTYDDLNIAKKFA